MATGGEETVGYSLAKVGTVTLKSRTNKPWYISIVVCQDKMVVIDINKCKVQLFRLHDGQFLATMDRLESIPSDLCLMDAKTICVLHSDGLIKMVSITDMSPVLKSTMDLRVQGLMDYYLGVVKFNDSLVVCGVKQDTMYWCVVSLRDGHVDAIHKICKRKGGWCCRVTTKDNIVYVACDAGVDNTGVYGFDISNPSQCKYKYKHQRLQDPTSIVVNEDGNIFVCCNGRHDDPCIHQLTASCQLVAIFTQEIPWDPLAMFWDNRRLYVTGYGSPDITVFTRLYQGNHEDSEVETSIEIEQGNLFQKRVEEKVNQAGIKMSTEEMDIFLSFQREIGTIQYFSKGRQTSVDGQESLMSTETFLQKNRPDMMEKWKEYKDQGKLTPELIDVIYAKERNPVLHDKKDGILKQMEKLNIIVKARSFNEKGVKEENYFFTPCILREESPENVISPEQDLRMLSTSVLCWVFTGRVLSPSFFQRLLAACLACWPVAKKKETAENLIFYNCTVFDLDLFHRLTLHCKNHVVFARITRMVIDEVETINAKLCNRVRKFITLNLSEINSSINQNLKYKLCVKNQDSQEAHEGSGSCFSPPFEMWLVDEVHDPDSPITQEHMNHSRLCVALVTVCGDAMREILLTNFPVPYKDIYQAVMANQARLTSGQSRLLNKDQSQLVFPDKKGRYTSTVDQFDLSLLYTLIRNVSTVPAPTITGWGKYPQDQPRDSSLGASLERIRSYRNHIIGHSPDGKISQQDFEDYWNKFEAVLHDIETAIGRQIYTPDLEKQKRQVISVYEAC